MSKRIGDKELKLLEPYDIPGSLISDIIEETLLRGRERDLWHREYTRILNERDAARSALGDDLTVANQFFAVRRERDGARDALRRLLAAYKADTGNYPEGIRGMLEEVLGDE